MNRLNYLVCHSLVDATVKPQASSFKLQQFERKETTCSETTETTRKLLPSRWASWGDTRLPSRDVLCCSCPIERITNVKIPQLFKASNCANPQETQTCTVLPMLRLNQCKDSSSFQDPAWQISYESWMNRPTRRQHSNTQTKMPFCRRKTITSRQKAKLKC